jgi:hypothetical protein
VKKLQKKVDVERAEAAAARRQWEQEKLEAVEAREAAVRGCTVLYSFRPPHPPHTCGTIGWVRQM